MGSRFYFKILAFLFSSFLVVLTLSYLSFQKSQIKHKKDILKLKLKIESSQQISFLNDKLDTLNDFLNKKTKLIKEADKTKELIELSERAHFIEQFFIYNTQDLNLPYYSSTLEEPELFQTLNLENKLSSLHKVYFEKQQWKGKSYFVFMKKIILLAVYLFNG